MKKTPELFDLRNAQVKEIEFTNKKKTDAKVGEFWRYREGINIGNEISKDGGFKRPCLVLQNNLGNGLFLIAPLTTKIHTWMDKYTIDIYHPERYNLKKSRVIVNQIRAIDRKRLVGKMSEKRIMRSFVDKVLDGFFSLTKKPRKAR